jgi:hypothetical protein
VSYDPKCYDLAETFLKDGGWTHTTDIHRLAQQIQDCIEDYMADLSNAMEARND